MNASDLDHAIVANVSAALSEDIGTGDITGQLIDKTTVADAAVICREPAVLCGQQWFDEVFRQLGPGTRIQWSNKDGDQLEPGTTVCMLQGNARSLLSGERCALNFLQTLSSTATMARRYSDLLKHYNTRILDTRKTIPGLRLAQKYAVRVGGCSNHRIGLFDGILIKENHIVAAGGIKQAVRSAKILAQNMPVEIEVENLSELEQAIDAGAETALLDNFSIADIHTAVQTNANRLKLEVSGNVTIDNLKSYAETGVDYISIGALTKNIKAVDLSMRIKAGY